MSTFESRGTVGLRTPRSRTRLSGARGVTAHWNGPAMGLTKNSKHSTCRARWRGVQAFHMNTNGWADVAYTAAVCPHGIAMEGRGKGVRTAANGTNAGNSTHYAVFFMVGGSEEPNVDMLRAAEWYARTRLGLTSWNRHKDHKATTCAGTVDKYVSGGRLRTTSSAATTPSKPSPTPPSSSKEMPVPPLVRRGSRGLAVRLAQSALVAHGYAPRNTIKSNGTLDGIFGSGTETSVKQFQRSKGLNADGIVGPNTWRAFYRV